MTTTTVPFTLTVGDQTVTGQVDVTVPDPPPSPVADAEAALVAAIEADLAAKQIAEAAGIVEPPPAEPPPEPLS